MFTIQKALFFFGSMTFLVSAVYAQGPSASERKLLSDFKKDTKAYIKLRDTARRKVPKIGDEATRSEIEAHKVAFQQAIRNLREGATRGEIFTEEVSTWIRGLIRNEFKGWERSELRKTVLEADTTGIALKVNAIYPETKELVEMSPALLLALPPLPKELRYRFIGRSLAILDRDTAIIVDYMKDALP
jgi:hypothetical protein